MQKEMEDDVSILILKYETAAKYADEETYNELLEMAKPIPNKQDMYEVEFGYFPYEKV